VVCVCEYLIKALIFLSCTNLTICILLNVVVTASESSGYFSYS